jgi:hypothetical protein
MNQIFLYKDGEIDAADKAALKSAGYLPVACKDLNNVAILFPDLEKIKGDVILQAALNSIRGVNDGHNRQKFGEALLSHLASNPKIEAK